MMLRFKQLQSCLTIPKKPTIVSRSPFLLSSNACRVPIQNWCGFTSSFLKIRPFTTETTNNLISNENSQNSANQDASQFPKPNPLFVKLHVNGRIIRAITDLGYKEPTPIQLQTIKPAIRGQDVVASAITGTGKTGAYLMPALHRAHLTICRERAYHQSLDTLPTKPRKDLEPNDLTLPLRKCASDRNHNIAEPLVLILTPTRELCEQVAENTRMYGKYLEGVKVLEIFGGINEKAQIDMLRFGVDVLIATPGRLLNLLKMKSSPIDLSKVQTFVVDECDRMLNLGFAPEMFEIREFLPHPNKNIKASASMPWAKTQVMMYSATLLPSVKDFIKRFTSRHLLVDMNTKMETAEKVKHTVYHVGHQRKHALLRHFLGRSGNVSLKGKQVLVFVSSQKRADRLAQLLNEDGFHSAALHALYSPTKREKTIQDFKEGIIQVLVATDVLSRGLDIPDLPYVVNYDVPANAEDFVHRVGRTGRAGLEGRALMFVDKDPQTIIVGKNIVEISEQHYLAQIEKFINKKLPVSKVPGPWRDEPKSGKERPESPRLLQLKEERLQEILQKKAAKDEARFKMLKERGIEVQEKKEREKEPELRDFKEGRFEDVINKFQERAARRRGFNPDDFRKNKQNNKR